MYTNQLQYLITVVEYFMNWFWCW